MVVLFWDFFSGCLPDWRRLPVTRESHAVTWYVWIICEQLLQPFVPMTLRGNAVETISTNRKHGKHAPIVDGYGSMPIGIVFRTRNHWLRAEFSIPKSAMVGADITHRVERQEPGIEHLGGHAKRSGDIFLNTT